MDLRINDITTTYHKFIEHEVTKFCLLAHDYNPIHTDKQYAEKSIFGKKVVPGMLAASFFSGLIGSKLPGKGSIYLEQNLKFVHPIYIGDTVLFAVEIISIREDKPIITLRTTCMNDDKENRGELLITGEAVVKAPKEDIC